MNNIDTYDFELKDLIDSTNNGPFFIDSRVEREDGTLSKTRVKIVFLNTETEHEVDFNDAIKGKVKDRYLPFVCDVGFIGVGPHKATNSNKRVSDEYTLWTSMIQRCYNPHLINEKFPTYKDVLVHPRWHNYQNFCEDLITLEGYQEWKNEKTTRTGEPRELDKDILCAEKQIKVKIYSKDTCKFVTRKENMVQRGLDRKAKA